jgi:adenine/guanine phosphoribosyltransferase-like PRPP-binding protein
LQSFLGSTDFAYVTGSMNAACELAEALGATVTECLVVMELEALKGRDKVKAPIKALFKF